MARNDLCLPVQKLCYVSGKIVGDGKRKTNWCIEYIFHVDSSVTSWKEKKSHKNLLLVLLFLFRSKAKEKIYIKNKLSKKNLFSFNSINFPWNTKIKIYTRAAKSLSRMFTFARQFLENEIKIKFCSRLILFQF